MNGSSRVRSFRAAITGLSSLGAKGLAGVISLLSIRLTLPYLGPERFGLWMTVAALQTVLAFADFGLGNGVLQTVSEAYAHRDQQLITKIVRTALVAQALIAATIFAGFASVYPSIHWASYLHVSNATAVREAGPTLFIFVSIFCVRSVALVVQQAQLGEQKGYVANAWTFSGNIAALAALFVAAHMHAGIPALCLIVTGLPALSDVLNVVAWFFGHPATPVAVSDGIRVDWHLLKRLVRIGLLFFFLRLGAVLNFGIDPLIVNQLLGSAAVATLTVVQRPFELMTIALLLGLQPLWPAYREAITAGDIPWVLRTLKRTLSASLLLSLGIAVILGFTGKRLIELWAGPSVHPSESLILAYCGYLLFSASQTPFTFFLNGFGKLRFQLLLAIPVTILSIALKIFLTPRFGLSAVPISTLLVGVLLMIPCQILYVRRLTPQLLRHTSSDPKTAS